MGPGVNFSDRGRTMKKMLSHLLLIPALLLVAIPSVHAADSAISTMAGIVMHLNHYPDGSEMKTLANISRDQHATSGERKLANALMHFRHHISDGDAPVLRQLQGDAGASAREKELAAILLGISHHPTASDKQRLSALTDD